MTTEELEESQSGIQDGGVGGPGAPTPLTVLEVCFLGCDTIYTYLISVRASQDLLRETSN